MNMPRSLLISLMLFFPFLANARADDWPQAGRDATRNPVSPEKNPPTWWQIPRVSGTGRILNKPRNVKWHARLGTNAFGSPIVANGLVWVGVNNGRPRDRNLKEPAAVLMCFDEKDGAFLYQYVTPIPVGSPLNLYRSIGHASSPMAQGDRLWFATVTGQVVCLDTRPLRQRKGMPREIWKRDLVKELSVSPGGPCCWWGTGCSISAPYKNRIYVTTGSGVDSQGKAIAPNAPSFVCLDAETGKVLWSDNSPGKNVRPGQPASPLVVEIKGQTQVVAPMGDGWLRSFDALSGKKLWEFNANPGPIPEATNPNNLLASPVFHEGLIFVVTGHDPGYGGQRLPDSLFCLDPTRAGDISLEITPEGGKARANPNSGVRWRLDGTDDKKRVRFSGAVAGVAVDKGLVFLCDVNGYVNCLDARTGKEQWKHDAVSEILAAPLVVDDKVFVASDIGVLVFERSNERKLLQDIEMLSPIHCAPIYANGVLYLACSDALYAIAGKDGPPLPKGEDWPQFGRDQTRNAVSPEKNPPLHWQLEERDDKGKIEKPARNIQWSVNLGSVTYGDPVVVEGSLWVGTNNRRIGIPEDKAFDASVLQCLDVNDHGKTSTVTFRLACPYACRIGRIRASGAPR